MSEWKTIAAEEYCDSVRDGTHDAPKQVDKGYKLVTAKHINNGQIDLSDAYLISEKDYIKVCFRKFPIPILEDESTMRDIVNNLSRYDSLIENYQKQIKLLDEAASHFTPLGQRTGFCVYKGLFLGTIY